MCDAIVISNNITRMLIKKTKNRYLSNIAFLRKITAVSKI